MALYRLSTDTMSVLSGQWLGARRAELQSISQTATILPILESAHRGLSPFVGRSHEPSGAKEVVKRQEDVDESHDNFYRAGFYYCNSQASLSAALGDEAGSQMFLGLRDMLYPDALFGVNRPYGEEESAAELLSRRVTPALKEKLSALYVRDGLSLWTIVERQMERAVELGALERQKRALQEQEQSQQPGPSLDDERRARYDWIEAVRMLERTLRLAVRQRATTEAIINQLLENVRQEEAAADRRHLDR